MLKVKELIEILQKENQDSYVLISGYEYGMEYLRSNNIISGKFNMPENDIGKHGGEVEYTDKGSTNGICFERCT
jgi:hypothetical protein